jgi:hypothetical protein
VFWVEICWLEIIPDFPRFLEFKALAPLFFQYPSPLDLFQGRQRPLEQAGEMVGQEVGGWDKIRVQNLGALLLCQTPPFPKIFLDWIFFPIKREGSGSRL